jgi:hypothetical protein
MFCFVLDEYLRLDGFGQCTRYLYPESVDLLRCWRGIQDSDTNRLSTTPAGPDNAPLGFTLDERALFSVGAWKVYCQLHI